MLLRKIYAGCECQALLLELKPIMTIQTLQWKAYFKTSLYEALTFQCFSGRCLRSAERWVRFHRQNQHSLFILFSPSPSGRPRWCRPGHLPSSSSSTSRNRSNNIASTTPPLDRGAPGRPRPGRARERV